MYCKVDLNPDGQLTLTSSDSIDLKCSRCAAAWRFWVNVQLQQKLLRGGKFNKFPKV